MEIITPDKKSSAYKAWADSHKDERRKYRQEWYQKFKARNRKQQDEYRLRNFERRATQKQTYYQRNLERITAYQKAYREKNRSKWVAYREKAKVEFATKANIGDMTWYNQIRANVCNGISTLTLPHDERERFWTMFIHRAKNNVFKHGE